MAWKVYLCNTVSGTNRVLVEAASFSWQRVLNSGGGGQAAFELGDARVAELVTPERTMPLARMLVLEWDDGADARVVYAGIIQSRTYDRASRRLTVTHQDLWSEFQARLVLNDRSNELGESATYHHEYTMGTIARRLVRDAVRAEPETMYGLPINFGEDTPGVTNRTYYGYHLTTVADAIQDLLDTEGCPDIDLSPYWTPEKNLRWDMKTGGLSTDTLQWNATADKSDVLSVSLTEDASKVTNGVFAVGEGSEEDMLVRVARDTTTGYPARERVFSFKQESDRDVLASMAAEQLRLHRHPTQQMSIQVLAGGDPLVSDLRLGMNTRLWFDGDPWMPEGWYESRLIQFSGDLSHTVSLELQPTGGV